MHIIPARIWCDTVHRWKVSRVFAKCWWFCRCLNSSWRSKTTFSGHSPTQISNYWKTLKSDECMRTHSNAVNRYLWANDVQLCDLLYRWVLCLRIYLSQINLIFFCEGVNLTTCGGGQGSFGAYRSSELPSLPKDDIGESIHEKFRGFTAILGNLVATSISRGGRRHDFNCVRKETWG